MNHVIVGFSIAGARAAAAILAREPEARVTAIDAEPEAPYGRPLIAQALAGEIPPAELAYSLPELAGQPGLVKRLGQRAIGLDPDGQAVTLASGERLSYDRLLLAMGGRPIRPPIPGLDRVPNDALLSLADVRSIQTRLGPCLDGGVQQALVVGGGFIGLKAAEALRRRGLDVTVIEMAPRLMATSLDAEASARVERILAENGVRVMLSETVTELHATTEGQISAALAGGGSGVFGLLVLAAGVAPDLMLVADTGITANRGILVDTYLATSIPGIYAAGDVVEVAPRTGGPPRVTATLPNAALQGLVAGTNMAGGDRAYPGSLSFNALEIFGHSCISLGRTVPEDSRITQVSSLPSGDGDRSAWRKLYFDRDTLVGAVCLDAPSGAGLLHNLILGATPAWDQVERMLAGEFTALDLAPADLSAALSGCWRSWSERRGQETA